MKIAFKKGQKPYPHKENCTCFRCSGICPWKGKSYKNFLGKKHNKLTKEIISKVHKGKRHSPETEFKKGLIPWNKGKSGYHIHSKGHLEKMRDNRNEFERKERPISRC